MHCPYVIQLYISRVWAACWKQLTMLRIALIATFSIKTDTNETRAFSSVFNTFPC